MIISWLVKGRSGDSQINCLLIGSVSRIATSSLMTPTRTVILSEAKDLLLTFTVAEKSVSFPRVAKDLLLTFFEIIILNESDEILEEIPRFARNDMVFRWLQGG